MSPYAEAALANLDEALETMRAATRARTDMGAHALLLRAQVQATNARAKLADAVEEARR